MEDYQGKEPIDGMTPVTSEVYFNKKLMNTIFLVILGAYTILQI